MRRPPITALFEVAVVGFLFVAPLVAIGESLYWWAPDDANPLAYDEAGLRPGTPEYDRWIQSHPKDTPHCSSWGSNPERPASGSAPCCPPSGGSGILHGSGGCGSEGMVFSSANGRGGSGSGGEGGGSGGALPGGSGGGGAGVPAPGVGVPGPGLAAAIPALVAAALALRRR